MKIIIPLTVDFGPAGGFRVLSQLANYWIDAGHDVSFLTYQQFRKTYYPTKAKMIFYDGFGRIVNGTSADFAPVKSLQLRWAAKNALDKLHADVVLATQSFSAAPVAKSRIDARKYYYVQAYEPDFYLEGGIKNRIFHRIAEKSYAYPLEKIVNAEMYRDYKGINTDKVVLPGLDASVFYPKEEKLTKKDTFIFGTIVRKQKVKGTDYVVDAFKKLRSKYGDRVQLHAAFGDESLSNIDGITILKPDGDENLAAFYRSIDCYICAGIFQLDAVHYPVIETMACKTALITTGYYPSTVNNAAIIETESSAAIVEAAEKIMEFPEEAEQKAVNALQDIEQFYWEKVSNKMLGYFQKANQN